MTPRYSCRQGARKRMRPEIRSHWYGRLLCPATVKGNSIQERNAYGPPLAVIAVVVSVVVWWCRRGRGQNKFLLQAVTSPRITINKPLRAVCWGAPAEPGLKILSRISDLLDWTDSIFSFSLFHHVFVLCNQLHNPFVITAYRCSPLDLSTLAHHHRTHPASALCAHFRNLPNPKSVV